MTRLSDETIVRTWERCADATAVERALALLAIASPDAEMVTASPLDVPIGARDAALVAVLRATFGERVWAFAACPSCHAALELPLDLARLARADDASGTFAVVVEELEVTFRLPSTRDVLAVARLEADEARVALARRCVVHAISLSSPVDPDELGPDVIDAIEQAMADADTGADIELALACPTCDHAFARTFDPPTFLWSLVDVRARRLFDDVDRLARAYGWTEREILALGPRRREVYLAKAMR